MDSFTMTIAGIPLTIEGLFSSTPVYFRSYLTPPAEEAARICVSREDLRQEQYLLDMEADAIGLKRRAFPEPFLERSFLMRRTAAIAAGQGILLLHGSAVSLDGRGYLFTARTGTGKSTHTRFWRELFGSRARMINDDRAFLKADRSSVLICGSPWSGKHGLDSNITAPLQGICILRRGSENTIRRISPEEALPDLLAQVFLPEGIPDPGLEALTRSLADTVPLWEMACTRAPEAAVMSHAAMSAPASV